VSSGAGELSHGAGRGGGLESVARLDPFDARQVRRVAGLLREFNGAGLLSPADVHVSLRLAKLGDEPDESVRLAVALAVRGPRLGHVFVDLETVRDTAAVETDDPVDLSQLSWPSPREWIRRVSGSPLVAPGEDSAERNRPLRLVGSRLYLDRYWREERQVAADIRTFAARRPPAVDRAVLAEGLARLVGSDADRSQRIGAGAAVLRGFAVLAGGPGTGKTTTVARIAALLAEQAAADGVTPPLIALAAPTGKAAARLQEAVHEEGAVLDVSPLIRARLLGLGASTLHRLLGWRPGSHSRFRHHRGNRLPHDAVIVDETSMVSLSLMARLLEAVRPDARLILVGDPGQLASIEAGVVLADIVGPVAGGLRMAASACAVLTEVTGDSLRADEPPPGVSVGDGIVVLDRVHRFGGGIAALAEAIRRGDVDGALGAVAGAPEEVTWIPVDAAEPGFQGEPAPVREEAAAAAAGVVRAAREGDARRAIRALGSFRLLCAHRRGPHGVAVWTARIEGWLAAAVEGFSAGDDDAYVGRPLLITENDYELRLYNGDTGVVVQTSPEAASAVFERGGELLTFSPSRLGAVETVYAMTIHKSQGSQFDTAAIVLPPQTSRILTRELLYTAVTRARRRVILVGTEATIRAAIGRPVARASGLRDRLWDGDGGT
jgi:exodeoxyribonuclease V alpha subunit